MYYAIHSSMNGIIVVQKVNQHYEWKIIGEARLHPSRYIAIALRVCTEIKYFNHLPPAIRRMYK